MRHDEVRELLLHHLTYSGVDNAKAHEIYHDDAVLEFPQSGERFLGKANMQGFRAVPGRTGRLRAARAPGGRGDVWIGEGRVLYDGANPHHFVWIVELRGDLVQRETIYFAEPFPAPEWRRPWAEEGAVWEPQGDLPARIPARS